MWYTTGVETDFYSLVNGLLDERGITKLDLAKRTGISKGLVYAVLGPAQEREPSADFCVRVAAALKVSPSELLKRAGFTVYPDAYELDALTAEALRILAQLTDDERGVVVRMLRGLASTDQR